MKGSFFLLLIASFSSLPGVSSKQDHTVTETHLRAPSAQRELSTCCDPQTKPGENSSPICSDGVACCPDGTWSCGIGDGTFPCGGETIPNPGGTVCGISNNDDSDDTDIEVVDSLCCNEEDFILCFIGVARCCPNSSNWACPNGMTEEYLCPNEGVVINPNGTECGSIKKCCDPKEKPDGDYMCDEGAGCCPDGTWVCSIGDGSFLCGDSEIPTFNPGGEVCEDTCSLPEEVGPCEGIFPRWFYNKATNSCDQFIFGGCDGNSNNFESKKDCEMLCQESCCDPRLEPGVNENPIGREEHRCCPDGSWGYSIGDAINFGCGIEVLTNPNGKVCDICSLLPEMGPCEAAAERWFYNTETDSCETFTYGGCDGNSNNFNSKRQCENICNPPAFPPITSSPVDDNNELSCCDPRQEPGVNGNPPSREGHRCCPGGSWGYSIGDAVNFSCGSEVLADPNGKVCDICSLPPEVGPCEAAIERWFYDIETDSCEMFTYGGCDGNSNNFNSKKHCERICYPDTPPPITSPPVDGENKLPCCDPFLEPGVFGNPPSFEGHRCCPDGSWGYSIGDAINFACGEKVIAYPNGKVCDICSLPPEAGPCDTLSLRWFYDTSTEVCQRFIYGGCDGNSNNFMSKEGCEETCPRSACCDEDLKPRCPSGDAACCPEGEWSCPDSDQYYMCEGDIVEGPLYGPLCPPETPSSSPTTQSGRPECFPGSSIVTIEGSGTIQMKELEIGDRILVADNTYEAVYSFGHYAPNVVVEMLHISTLGRLSSTLRLSRDHLVYVASRKTAIPADHVRIGDKLINEKGDEVTVQSIKGVKENGLYAPFTPSGTLIVDGISVSSYAALTPSSKYIYIFGFQLSHHWVYHISISPYRIVRRYLSADLYYREQYEPNGINSGLIHFMKAAKPLLQSQSFMANLSVLLILVFSYALNETANFITAELGLLRFVLILSTLIACIPVYFSRIKCKN